MMTVVVTAASFKTWLLKNLLLDQLFNRPYFPPVPYREMKTSEKACPRSIFHYNSSITLCEFLMTRVNIFSREMSVTCPQIKNPQSHLKLDNQSENVRWVAPVISTTPWGDTVLPNGESPTGLDSEKTEELCAKVCELTGQRRISVSRVGRYTMYTTEKKRKFVGGFIWGWVILCQFQGLIRLAVNFEDGQAART